MGYWLRKNREYLYHRQFLKLLGLSFLFLMGSIVVTTFAVIYATNSASGSVTDIILGNIRVYDVGWAFVYGPIIFWVIIGIYLFHRPHKIPFTFNSIALFMIIRSMFIILTHIGPSPLRLELGSSSLLKICCTGNDLFFSSHTGMPFLMALLFWNHKKLRYFSLVSSLVFGAVVLLGHLHYSIDVFAAFFITYAIWHLAESFFKKDKKLFNHGLEALE